MSHVIAASIIGFAAPVSGQPSGTTVRFTEIEGTSMAAGVARRGAYLADALRRFPLPLCGNTG